MPRKQKVTGPTITAAERRAKALDMRKLGFTYQQIADEHYNGNKGFCHRDMDKAFEGITAEAAERVRVLELERLDFALTKLMPKILKGDTAAIQTMIKIQERRSKYLGLDTPVQIDQMGAGVVNVVFDPSLGATGMAEAEVVVDPMP